MTPYLASGSSGKARNPSPVKKQVVAQKKPAQTGKDVTPTKVIEV